MSQYLFLLFFFPLSLYSYSLFVPLFFLFNLLFNFFFGPILKNSWSQGQISASSSWEGKLQSTRNIKRIFISKHPNSHSTARSVTFGLGIRRRTLQCTSSSIYSYLPDSGRSTAQVWSLKRKKKEEERKKDRGKEFKRERKGRRRCRRNRDGWHSRNALEQG
jgi:hypothetical protein